MPQMKGETQGEEKRQPHLGVKEGRGGVAWHRALSSKGDADFSLQKGGKDVKKEKKGGPPKRGDGEPT